MSFNPGSYTLLKGRVGSKAFGLANENSDDDYQGLYVAPTSLFLGLDNRVQESYSYKNPDTTYHEAGKYCRLALGCNPTVLDLLWLEDYNVRTELGTELINLRSNFLSLSRVKGAYLSYANDQFVKLLKDERPEKRAKNARHFLRLLIHGSQIWVSGTYSVKLQDPEYVIDFGRRVGVEQDIQYAQEILANYDKLFKTAPSALPDKPNKEPINEWLLKVRHEFYRYSDTSPADSLEKFKEWP